MSLADEIVELLEESDKVEAEFSSLDRRLGEAFHDLEQDLLKIQFLQSIEADLEEDSVESLMRAQERFSSIIKVRIEQKLDED